MDDPGTRQPVRSDRRRLLPHLLYLLFSAAAIGGSLLLGVGGGRVTLPGVGWATPSVCMFKNLTGLDCPGCGLSRAFICIAHGDMAAAWGYNPASWLVFFFVAVQIPYRIVQILRLRRGRSELYFPRAGQALMWCVVVALVSQWLFKTAFAIIGS